MDLLKELNLDSISEVVTQNLAQDVSKEPPVKDKEEEVIKDNKEINGEVTTEKEEDNVIIEDTPTPEEVPEDNDDESSEKSSPIIPYVKSLQEYGVLSNIKDADLEGKTPQQVVEYLMKAQEDEILDKAEAIVSEHYSKLPPKFRMALEKYAEGADLNLAYEAATKIEELNKISEDKIKEDSDLARKLLKEDFISKGYDESEAEELANEPIDPTKPALKAHKRLIESENKRIEADKIKRDNEAKKAQQDREEYFKSLKSEINSRPEIIKGLPINNKIREEVWKNMTTPVKEVNGQALNAIMAKRAENPKEFELKLNYLFAVTKGFEDFSSLYGQAKRTAISELEKAIEKDSYKSSNKSGTSAKVDSGKGVDLLSELKKLK